MKMKDHLPPAFLHIEKKFVPGDVDLLFFSHLPGSRDHFGQNVVVRWGKIIDAADMPFGYDQQMDGGVGVDVSKNNQVLVLV